MPRALDVLSPGSVPIMVGVGEEMMSKAATFPIAPGTSNVSLSEVGTKLPGSSSVLALGPLA